MTVHGLDKLVGGPAGFGAFLSGTSVPAPTVTAWAVTLGETAGGVFLVLGLLSRLTALLLTVHLCLAMALVNADARFMTPRQGAASGSGIEFPLVMVAAFLVVLLAGPGPLALDTRLVPLGTAGGPTRLDGGRRGVSSAVVYGDRVHLVDLGHGAMHRPVQSGLGAGGPSSRSSTIRSPRRIRPAAGEPRSAAAPAGSSWARICSPSVSDGRDRGLVVVRNQEGVPRRPTASQDPFGGPAEAMRSSRPHGAPTRLGRAGPPRLSDRPSQDGAARPPQRAERRARTGRRRPARRCGRRS